MVNSVKDWSNDIGLLYGNLKIIARKRTRNNKIILAESPTLGHILIINGEVQHVEAWEFLYHEALVHIPMAFMAKPKKALVIGGGSLNALREILKYKSIESVTLVELDHVVIDLMLRLNKRLRNLLNERRVRFIEGDGYEYVLNTNEKFDLIINDALDLTKVRPQKNMFEQLQGILNPEGICADVVYRHIYERQTVFDTLSLLRFSRHRAFGLVFVPEYPGILHLLVMWGNNSKLSQSLGKPINEEQRKWLLTQRVPCRYYDPKHLNYYLYLPRYLKLFLRKIRRTFA